VRDVALPEIFTEDFSASVDFFWLQRRVCALEWCLGRGAQAPQPVDLAG
jgi:hypothetical protein